MVEKFDTSKSEPTKQEANAAPVSKPVVAAQVEAPKPAAAAPAHTKAEAAKPAAAAPAVAKKEAPKPAVAKVAARKPVAKAQRSTKVAAARVIAKSVASARPTVHASKPVKTAKPVKAPTIAKGKSIMNDTVTKVQETAQKFTADATERATAMFGDVSARAKTAVEKGSKSVEEMVEFSKGNLEAVVASGRVAAKGAEEIAKYSAEYGRKAIETANANAKKFAAVKSPTEFFQLQSEVAKSQLDSLVGEASKFSESYLKLLGEVFQPIQNRYAVAVEKVKTSIAA